MVLNEILRNYSIVRQNPGIQWWFNDFVIAEEEQSLDLQESVQSAKFCNLGHYLATRGWIGW